MREYNAMVDAAAILRTQDTFSELWGAAEQRIGRHRDFMSDDDRSFYPERPLVVATALHRTAAIAIRLALAGLEEHLADEKFALVGKLIAAHSVELELLLKHAIEETDDWGEFPPGEQTPENISDYGE